MLQSDRVVIKNNIKIYYKWQQLRQCGIGEWINL